MKTSKLLKEIKGVFKPPRKEYYLGKLIYGTPYFWPQNFCSTIFNIRKLKEKTQEQIDKEKKDYPYKHTIDKFSNLPMARRTKAWIFKLFGSYYRLSVGWPIKVHRSTLGWKDKFESPRYEWSPAFLFYFFKWQFCIFYTAPKIQGQEGCQDNYWEMILWHLYYCDKDIQKSQKEWSWVNLDTKESTWNTKYLE